MKRRNISLIRICLILLVVFFAMAFSTVAYAKTKITLDKKGRAGCLACHSDPNIYRIRNGKKESLFINPDRFYSSVHKNRACMDCHTDWEFRTHKVKSEDFKKTAGLACIRCHKHNKQYNAYRDSIHARVAMGKAEHSGMEAKGKDGATCGKCHNGLEPRGIHYIKPYPKKPKTWRDSKYWTKFRFSADKICGQCHMDRFKSYNDYYHGRAYKTGEVDAPTCWTCHNQHAIFRKSETQSTITRENMPQTCGRCHPSPTESFTKNYSDMIHGRDDMYKDNFILKYFRGVKASQPVGWATNRITGAYETITGWIKSIAEFFLPESLRPQETSSN